MQAIIFADRKGNELTPLCDATCPALLQVANRPLLEYTLEDLSQAGVEEAFIVVSQQADQIEAHFAKGEMWGMRFHYLLSRGEEAPEALLERYASLLAPEFLALRGDLLRPALCRDFFQVSRVILGKNIE
ncbi:MAG: sugar phosphate nucleotidyltransferase, partial [Candidatus Thiodiazotropha sp.]